MDHWVLGRAADLLSALGPGKAVKILKGLLKTAKGKPKKILANSPQAQID